MKVQIGNDVYVVRWEHFPGGHSRGRGMTYCDIFLVIGEDATGRPLYKTVAIRSTTNKGTDVFSKIVGRRESLNAALRYGVVNGHTFTREERRAFWDAYKASGMRLA